MSNSVGRIDHFLAKARKLSTLPTSLDIFDIRQHYVRILYIHVSSCKMSSLTTARLHKLRQTENTFNVLEAFQAMVVVISGLK